MKNPYLDKDDIGFITIYIVALIILLIYARSIWVGTTYVDIETNIVTSTEPVGQTQITKTEIIQAPALPQDNDNLTIAEEKDNTDQDNASSIIKKTPVQGEEIAKTNCYTCHQHGLLDAPKIGIREKWEPRLERGFDSLYNNALNGFNSMPAKGGNPNLKDNEIEQAILFMLAQSNLTVPGKTMPSEPVSEDNIVSQQEGQPAPDDQPSTLEINQQADVDNTNPDNVKTNIAQSSNTDLTIIDEEPIKSIVVEESPGKEIYNSNCASCHDNGSDNAPMIGKQDAWLSSFSKGIDTLSMKIRNGSVSHAEIKESEIKDIQITHAINYIMQQTFWPNSN